MATAQERFGNQKKRLKNYYNPETGTGMRELPKRSEPKRTMQKVDRSENVAARGMASGASASGVGYQKKMQEQARLLNQELNRRRIRRQYEKAFGK